jgi:hypothetical protein
MLPNFKKLKMTKRLFISIVFISAVVFSYGQVLIGTETPSSSKPSEAVLEVKVDKQGILIPRVNIPDFSKSAPISDPKANLIVVNTNSGSGKGLVFWDGTQWEPVITRESAKTYMLSLGKEVSFIGGTKSALSYSGSATSTFVRLSMNQIVLNEGEVSNHEYIIPRDGVYEISAKWDGLGENGAKGYASVRIRLNSGGTISTLKEGKGNKDKEYTGVSASALYSGYFKKGDKISYEMKCVDGTSGEKVIVTTVNLMNIEIKRLTLN